MADTEEAAATENGGPGEKEATKTPSPKPDTEVAPPIVSIKGEGKDDKKEDQQADKPARKTQVHQRRGASMGRPAPSPGGHARVSRAKKGVSELSGKVAALMAQKKTVVLSGEAMKDLAKQAKATKDERRLQLDARHQYIFTKLGDALQMEPGQVEDQVLGDERFDLIEPFFSPEGPRVLMFFHQETLVQRESNFSRTDAASSIHAAPAQKKLFLTTGSLEGLTGVALFFTKTTIKPILANNIVQDVNFGMMDASKGGVLNALESMLSAVLVPALRAQESWGDLPPASTQVQDFLEVVDKFVGSLSGARDNMEGKIELEEPDLGYHVYDLRHPSEFMQAATNADLMEKVENLIGIWSKQIEQVLAESEQMRKEADDIGPAAELDHWKKRMAKFNSLLDQIKSQHCKAVVGVLTAAKSRMLKRWKELDSRITDAANEAKDNVKYLYTLDKFFGPLTKNTPTEMVEHIPSLMNNIRMIHSISQYYNTSERMTSLFVKVTNQMITTCKAYITQGITKVWDHERAPLLKRISECIELNRAYQRVFHKTKEKLKENPHERQFEFSENYIFGKFDTFCKRLEKVADMLNTMESLSGLSGVKIEGMEAMAVRYSTIVTNTKKKQYDVLDHRKSEFDNDYMEFRGQIDGLQMSLQNFVDQWFERNLTTEKALELLEKFEMIRGAKLDLEEKYMRVLGWFGRDLENIRKAYQKFKDNPSIPRNLPPVAGKIAWARQLYRKIETPMQYFKKKPDIMRTAEAKKAIRSYNKMATVLLEFEMLYHRAWCRAVETIKTGMNASLVVRHPETKQLYVNFDPAVMELMVEAKYLKKMGLEVPDSAYTLCLKNDEIKQNHIALKEVLREFEGIVARIPNVLLPLMRPFINQVEEAVQPGLTMLTWTSVNIDTYIGNIYKALNSLELLTKQASDVLECRIESVLNEMSFTALCDLPDDEPVQVSHFLEVTEKTCNDASTFLAKQSALVEEAVFELMDLLDKHLKPSEQTNLEVTILSECQPCCYFNLLTYYNQRNTEALVKCTRLSLEAIKRRLQTTNKYQEEMRKKEPPKHPLFKAEIILAIPNVVMRPSLDDIQSILNKAVQHILSMAKCVPQWAHTQWLLKQHQRESEAAQEIGEDAKLMPASYSKSLDKVISEHKDITKVVVSLNSIIGGFKVDCQAILEDFNCFKELWTDEPADTVKEFMDSNPIMSEFEAQLRYYQKMQTDIEELPVSYRVGSVVFMTEPLQTALISECKNWKRAFGKALNTKASSDMEFIFNFIDDLSKRLSRPIKDLDDVRAAMAALAEIRENEIKIDMTIGPIEETYMLLNKFELFFEDGNAERVDNLRYSWNNLLQQMKDVQNHLLQIQPTFKADLLAGVVKYQEDTAFFYGDYDSKGPNVQDIPPREASDRLVVFQARFDELWAKYNTYSGGEELFGLTVQEYPDLQRIRRELALSQKLYGLYNTVIESVSGYYDILWNEVDIEKINNELLDFQNKCRKLPKGLKEWQAFEDLKKKIDDFSETIPLLEMMSNNAMMPRHWDRLSQITNTTFDVDNENFQLRNIMEAPLLENREDIEDTCIAAIKERDIEGKLKQVIAEWSAQSLSFGQFKSRGELLLKGNETSEIIVYLEDSLMILSSLMSNRYNAPFKPTIQQWVQKLSQTSEIIENWLVVQNLWVYLEAVFVGGDIAKQLPQEAKRFSNIDKSWIKIMQRAHENPNVVACCTGDDTMSQLLPHLLEQLELCQKSLTGYLEKKRLIFPRFFFVSDPALLEILGQASDSHTIQSHLLSLFDNVYRVDFHEKEYDKILAINSQEGEKVELVEPVVAQGNVELWLGKLQEVQQKSIHSVTRSASLAIADQGFKLVEFENMFPAQIGLLGIQMLWTRDSEEALSNARTDKKVMQTTNQHFLDMLNMLIDMTTEDLSKYERTKYETLITIHVHQRDIFDDLVRMHIRTPSDFEWLKQSRFYYNEDMDKCVISITDVDFQYCNEYVGCTERLVITPLTDRCYITLAQAIGMSMGGAPAGPAGTGKTETTKDMGRCLGKYVVVFNCSDQMDFRGLGRIYKGLAQSGSWGCFDEFNRIELPVLSVAAQQIQIVLACKKERKSSFIFMDGDIVSMNPEFGIFLTMNPGYAGRQELPENLKINFRTVAMMVPDRQIIIRVKLASCGFQQNIVLARKFFILYKLCEEQLSKQVHYDFGLRNILSCLRTMGGVKRASPDDTEATIVMRVLRDMNLSKLVDEDEPLFMSLIEDLFPGIQLDKAGYPELEAAIEKECDEFGLQHHPPWVLKLIQLYETQRVRHGFMALGPTGGGKTKCIHLLMKAMTDIGEPHREMRMNPKAITAPQMFGTLDVATNDWTDGIFSTLWRRTHKVKKGEHIWLVLDGPVDTLWIENLNSVLDDNKTLTLANGDRIPMAMDCKIVFEPDNVDNASPATVSRNGMVFMSSSVLDWDPIIKAWLRRRPPQQAEILWNLVESIFPDLYIYVKQSLWPKMKTLECNYVKQLIDLLEGLIPTGDDGSPKNLPKDHLAKIFIFALMWSLGSLLELEDRAKMEDFLRKHEADLSMPPIEADSQDTMFEFYVDDNGAWKHWNTRVEPYIYAKDSVPDYASILVPNVDNVRTDYLMEVIMKQEKAVMLIGEQGTAKTVIIKGYMGKYDPEQHLTKALNFSSATQPLTFQRTIESYVDKRVGTTYGPPAGKHMTVFVDDINMPVINDWGDQITNEVVRQLVETKGFYNLEKPGEFTNIVDMQFVAAMIHPGGGRNDIPARLKRQFTIYNCTLPSNASMDKIFTTIADGYFIKERGFKPEVKDLAVSLVPCTRRLWQATKVKMLPTPAKFHYIFNLRDLSRIWQGMLTVTSEINPNNDLIMRLWKHECTRVIADRFTNHPDKEWFETMVFKIAEEDMGTALAENVKDGDSAYFVDFLRDAPEATGDEPDDADLDAPKIYEPVDTLKALSDRALSFQEQYNETVRGGKMDLVFFEDALIHLLKISRIIRTPIGNAMLVGVGGSGKQSLTRLASYIAGYKTFQIVLSRTYNASNLLDDLKVLYRMSGLKGQGVTFIFTDNEIKDEGFLEYMNNLLATGEISNLFARDEIDEITSELIPVMKQEFPRHPPTNENLYNYFLSRARSNLHVVLCFSPVGENFRSRALKFPALFSGCTMDWFLRWPKDALIAVADYFLANFQIRCTDEVKNSVVNTMGKIHDLVAEKCVEYFERFRRQMHVTPKSYLSFLAGYRTIYTEHLNEVGTLDQRMKTGLAKLVEAQESVNELSKELAVKEKDLAVASKNADKVLVEVTASAQAAEKVKAQVQKVKDKAQAIVDEIAADKGIAEGKLAAAKPALEEAEAALQTIKPADIATVRKLGKPPHLIMRIMDCTLLLFQRKINTVTQDPERPCASPSWSEALKLMNNSGFLQSLLTFPKDTINEETVELLSPYLEMEDYNLESAKKVCGNVAGLCAWTRAMAFFYTINKEVLPLKANLAVQEARLGVAMGDLNTAQAQLDAKQKELDIVQAQYDAAMKTKQDLLDDAEACRRKMNNAEALIHGLSGEKVRWTAASKTFEDQIRRLVGDVLLATGFLSYSGPFNQVFRDELMVCWKKEMVMCKIPYTEDINLVTMLVDNATIGDWNLQGLPNDELSSQNGIITTKAARFPLMIDPQNQGKTWIRNMQKDNELQVTSLNHKYFRTHLEDALSLGRPLLVEDVGEELDPALDNVLERNFIKSGSTFKVKVGDKEVDVMNGFKLYITTKLANPAYTPEVAARTMIIDFTVTMKGLEDQLLGRVILTEKAELEAERTTLLEEVNNNKRKMKELEDNLLYRLTSTEGSLVEDESLIEVLRVTKTTAEEVSEKLAIAAETEIKINTAREEFRPVASRGSVLYFLIVEMSLVNVMYQTALKQFLHIFDISMARSQKSPIPSKRIANIIEYLTFEVFAYTVRGLYEQDKLLYTLLLALKLDLQAKGIRHEEFQTFIKGGAALDLNAVEPKPKKWILDMTWLNLVQLSKLPQFSQIVNQVARNDKGWKTWFDSDAPEDEPIPDGYDSSLDIFGKTLLVRSWCPDRTIPQARNYISERIGVRFAEGVILNMEQMWEESTTREPMVCFLSMGSDPSENIERLAKSKGMPIRAISMGQGQEVHARRLVSQFMAEGGWVLLQNCHLGLDYMEELLDVLNTTENINETYRTWLTTEVHKKFPINLLQQSIKYTNEPPQGVKAGLKRTYAAFNQEFIDISNMPQWKPMLYGVAFLHTTVQERRKFGPLGWNIPYEFNQADFNASVQFVQNHLDELDLKKGVSWNTVRYMLGEIQYGGRVTDDLDKILLNTYCKVWFGDHMFGPNFVFYKGYPIPKCKNIQEYRDYIQSLPLKDTPEVFGLHPNADITYQTSMANSTLGTIVSIQPKESAGGGGETRESVVQRLANEMLEKLPPDYVPHEVKERLRKMGHLAPMNIFLRQEIDRMQRVITLVRTTLTDLNLAIEGTIIMSENLRDALDNMYDARVPMAWKKVSWESATLGFWFTELLERNTQFSTWVFEGRPLQFWMTGFFNPQGFLTAMRQEITRAHAAKGWALDMVILHNDVTRMFKEDVVAPPPTEIGGVYVYGLFLDGASWDRKNIKLIEPQPKVLFTNMPVVHIYAINNAGPKDETKKQTIQYYSCPVYKKPKRTDLTFILHILLKTTVNPEHWVLRGAALLCDTK
ncbi:dynein axonemal heavy chain 5-like [Branchiostoma lanceolatum]|uniref:dynein axonemal heavy chain 5-like n=1 Tax=Branchiostoma lanceolatum TaxID=7740 RepID=UPI0034519984